MKPSRLAFLIRSFWPVMGHPQTLLGELTATLSQKENCATVLSTKTNFELSDFNTFRNVPVFRYLRGRRAFWGCSRLETGVKSWIEKSAGVDAFIAWGLGEELEIAQRISREHNTRLIVRLDEQNLAEYAGGKQMPRRWKLAIALCDHIIINAPSLRQILIDQHISPNRIRLISDAVEMPPVNCADDWDRTAARKSLAKINVAFEVLPEQAMALCALPMTDEYPFERLLRAWKLVVERMSSARLFLMGDGPAGQAIWNRIHSLNLMHNVTMTGWFDDWDQLITAADVYIHPHNSPGICYGLFRSSVRGLPSVCLGGSDVIDWLAATHSGLVVNSTQFRDLAHAITQLLRDQDLRRTMSKKSIVWGQQHASIEEYAAQFVSICGSQVAEKSNA